MKKNLAVFFGGRSCEHDVSVITGQQAMHNADPALYNVIPVYIAGDGRWYTGEKLRDVGFFKAFDPGKAIPCALLRGEEGKAELTQWPPPKRGLFGGGEGYRQPIDVAMPCFHGMNGEDGTIQGLFELLDLPYTSAGLAGSAVGMDKIAQKALLRGCGIQVLPMCWFDRQEWEADPEAALGKVEAELPYPLYVKPANLGSSIGISRADDREGLRRAIDVAAAFDRRILIETALEKPLEVNCSALGYGEAVEASVCEMPIAWQEFLSFEDKYLRGDKGGQKGGMANLKRQIPAPISEKMTAVVQSLSLDIFRALDLKGVVRIDYMIDQATGNLYVNEVNTIPGSLAYYLWEPKGLIFARLIDRMVECAFLAQEQKDKSNYSYTSNILSGFSGAKGK